MRLAEIGSAERRLVEELGRRISNRLETSFAEAAAADGAHVGIELRERNRRAVVTIPVALLANAAADAVARESVRVRLKAARDRMLYRPPPERLAKHVAAAPDVVPARSGFGPPHRRGRR